MEDQKQPSRCQGCWRWIANVTDKCLVCLKDNVPHPLAKVHGAAGALLLVQAIVTAIMTLVFGNRFGQAIEFKRTHLFTQPVSPLVPCFMGVAAAGHIWPALGHRIAVRFSLFRRITEHKGWLRWFEKAISVSLMYAMVALLCDQEAAVPLLWLILITWCSMGIRFVMERDVEHKLFGHGRYSKSHPDPISKKNVLSNFVDAIEQRVGPVRAREGDEEDPNANLLEVVPDSSGGPAKEQPSSAISSDWEVITSSLIMDAIALGMFLPYYIDNIKHERWFVHASVGTLIVTVFGYTGLLLLYRRAALNLQAEGQDKLTKEDEPVDTEDRRAWEDQDPSLKRTKLHALYETLEKSLIAWSVLTTSGLGWLVMIGVLQTR